MRYFSSDFSPFAHEMYGTSFFFSSDFYPFAHEMCGTSISPKGIPILLQCYWHRRYVGLGNSKRLRLREHSGGPCTFCGATAGTDSSTQSMQWNYTQIKYNNLIGTVCK